MHQRDQQTRQYPTSHTEHEQANFLTKIFSDIFKERLPKSIDSELNYSVVFVVKSLLTFANKEIFEEYFCQICEFVALLKSSKSSMNQVLSLL